MWFLYAELLALLAVSFVLGAGAARIGLRLLVKDAEALRAETAPTSATPGGGT